ncbi:putative ribonuclease H-like domain-containing protein [Tanacetum coccineum]
MRPFGCPVTILDTIDHLGKFDGKADEGFFVGYSLNSSGPDWLFDIDALTRTMNYEPIVAGTQSNGFVDTKASDNAGQARKETKPIKNYILLPLCPADPPSSQDPKSSQDDGSKPSSDDGKKVDEDSRKDSEGIDQEKEDNVNSINNVNAASTNEVNVVGGKISIELPFDPNIHALEDYSIFDSSRDDEDDGAEADMNNLDTTIQVSPIPTTRIQKDHPLDKVIGDLQSATQTRRMSKSLEEHGFVSTIQQRTNHKDLQNCLFACFLSQEEPKKLQEVWTLVDLPNGKRAIGTKWVFRNKKDERGIMIRNKARLVAQGYTQEEGIDYDVVFSAVARIEAIRLFLAYASFKDFVVYQMDVKSAFIYGKIEEEVYVCQPPGFEDPNFPDRVYKVKKALQKGDILLVQVYVDDIIFGSTKKELCNAFEKLTHEKFQMSSMGELTFFLGLQVQQKKDGKFISQDKYVDEILKKFGFTEVKTASTSMETQKPLLKDEDGEEVDVHMYRSMIDSLMYLTSSRPDIMFAVCACARYQVNPKVLHLYDVKRIFRYLKRQPKLGLWYLKDSSFDLVAYTNSDYAGASLDRKSTTGGCQFLGCRLISQQCKKQTVVANSITEAEYVAASSCYRQVLWIQNQLLNYGQSVWTGIGVNAGNSKLMLLGINLILLVKVNAARHKLNIAGFEQIVDFLSAHPIKHALTVNPTIYTLCIEQLWVTIKAKIVNGEVQLQALVDGKKIIITESTVRRDLQLEDAEGVDCLPDATIFEQLALMGSKTTAWNEFSSTMASAIICLATNQKFNFSKYIFESMVKNLDNVGKFLMYPRFIQVFLDKQLEGMPTHNRIYIAPSHTKKIFRNIRRVGKGFSGRETPLFLTIVVQDQAKMGEGSANPIDPYHTPTFIQPSTSQPQKKQKPRKPKKKDTQISQSSVPSDNVVDEVVYKELDDSLVRAATTASSLEAEHDSGNIINTRSKATPNEVGSQGTTSGGSPRRQETIGDTIAQTRFKNVTKLSNDPLLARGNTLRSGEDSLKLNELMELCTNLQQRVLDLETTKTTQANEIATRVESSGDEESLGEDASKQGRRIHDIDADEDITLVNDQDDADIYFGSKALAALKSVNPGKSNVVEEPSVHVSAANQREETLQGERNKSLMLLTKEWDDIQAKVDVDYQLAQKL